MKIHLCALALLYPLTVLASPSEWRSTQPKHSESPLPARRLIVVPEQSKSAAPSICTLPHNMVWESGMKPLDFTVESRAWTENDVLAIHSKVSGVVAPDENDFLLVGIQPLGEEQPLYIFRAHVGGKVSSEILETPHLANVGKFGDRIIQMDGLDVQFRTEGDVLEFVLRIPSHLVGVSLNEEGPVGKIALGFERQSKKERVTTIYAAEGFHRADRYGVLYNYNKADINKITSIQIKGQLLDDKGKPVSWHGARKFAALIAGDLMLQTDDLGFFSGNMTVLPGETPRLETNHPQFGYRSWNIDLSANPVEFGELEVKPKQYISRISAPTGPFEPLLLQWVGEEEQMAMGPLNHLDKVSLLTGPGLVDLTAIAIPQGKVGSNAVHIEGDCPPGTQIEMRWVHPSWVRDLAQADDTAKLLWRFLRTSLPEEHPSLPAILCILARSSPKATPGEVTLSVVVNSREGGSPLRIPLDLEVLPISLSEKSQGAFGIFYETNVGGWSNRQPKSKEAMEQELRWIAEQGVDFTMLSRVIFEKPEEIVRLQVASGLRGPYFYDLNRLFRGAWTLKPEEVQDIKSKTKSESFINQVKEQLGEIDRLEEELGVERNSIVCFWGDEIQRYDSWLEVWFSYARVYRKLTERPALITVGTKGDRYLNSNRAISRLADVLVFSGVRYDMALEQEPSLIPDTLRLIDNPDSRLWTYYNNTRYDKAPPGLISRISNGIWLYSSPFTANTPWTFDFFENSPLTDWDNDTMQQDMVYAFRENNGLFSTSLMWEGLRKGNSDYRILKSLAEGKKSDISEDRIQGLRHFGVLNG